MLFDNPELIYHSLCFKRPLCVLISKTNYFLIFTGISLSCLLLSTNFLLQNPKKPKSTVKPSADVENEYEDDDEEDEDEELIPQLQIKPVSSLKD